MQAWVLLGAWLFAAVFALVLLGFAGYELSWKQRRLRRDTVKLQQSKAELLALTAQLQALGRRAAVLREQARG